MARRRNQADAVGERRAGTDDVAEAGVEDQRDRIGIRIVIGASIGSNSVVELVTDVHVAGVDERRHPFVTESMGVPPDVVLVQMGVDDEVDVPRIEAGRREPLEPGQVQIVPERQRALLGVADARVDEPSRPRLDAERLHPEGDRPVAREAPSDSQSTVVTSSVTISGKKNCGGILDVSASTIAVSRTSPICQSPSAQS